MMHCCIAKHPSAPELVRRRARLLHALEGGNCFMRASTTIAIALAVSALAGAGSIQVWADDAGAPNSIKVVVTGLHSNDGEVDCALFGTADGFPGDPSKAGKTTKSKIENGQAVCIFGGVAPGDYGVSVFHDENGNGKLDRNFMGMPKEGVGASNDAVGHFGPPKFDDARFTYKGGPQTLTIHVTYLLAPL
jgi:uncharacterized protein (DUF2141 family)